MVIIPIRDFSSFEQDVSLDGIPYTIIFDYNVRAKFWTVSFKDDNQAEIISGIKLVLGYNLFDQYRYLPLPPGELFVIDTTDDIKKIDRANLIQPLVVVYINESEV